MRNRGDVMILIFRNIICASLPEGQGRHKFNVKLNQSIPDQKNDVNKKERLSHKGKGLGVKRELNGWLAREGAGKEAGMACGNPSHF